MNQRERARNIVNTRANKNKDLGGGPRVHIAGAGGSNPSPPTNLSKPLAENGGAPAQETAQETPIVFERPHPFTRCIISVWCGDENSNARVDEERWRPGAWGQYCYSPEDVGPAAHAMGVCRFEVQGEYKPGRYPTRVFFTQVFIDPNGKEMRRSGLRIKTKYAFARQLRGLPFEYELVPDMEPIRS